MPTVKLNTEGKPTLLVGCEHSGVVAYQFAKAGWYVVTCDLLPADYDPHYSVVHYQRDVFDAIDLLPRWDMIILHPPCTAMAVSGNAHYGAGKPKEAQRNQAISWTNALWNYAVQHADAVALENPVGVLKLDDGTKPVYVQPYEFGHNASKKTGLWLYNLEPLKPTKRVKGRMVDGVERFDNQTDSGQNRLGPSPDRWKVRSKTYEGIAEAMAEQWGNLKYWR